MTIPRILLTDRAHAGSILMHPIYGPPVRYIISIGEADSKPPAGFGKSRAIKTRLLFDDIERARVRPPFGYVGPAPEDARQIIRLGKIIAQDPGITLVHCAAGISRSSAATLLLLATLLGPDKEEEAVAHLLDIAKQCTAAKLRGDDHIHPNRRLVWLGDREMKRDGKLLAATLKGLNHIYAHDWEPEPE